MECDRDTPHLLVDLRVVQRFRGHLGVLGEDGFVQWTHAVVVSPHRDDTGGVAARTGDGHGEATSPRLRRIASGDIRHGGGDGGRHDRGGRLHDAILGLERDRRVPSAGDHQSLLGDLGEPVGEGGAGDDGYRRLGQGLEPGDVPLLDPGTLPRLPEAALGHVEGRHGLEEELGPRLSRRLRVAARSASGHTSGRRHVDAGHVEEADPLGQRTPTQLVGGAQPSLAPGGEVGAQRLLVVATEPVDRRAHDTTVP